MKQRFLAGFLSLVMVLSLLPTAALAAEVPAGDTEAVSADAGAAGDTKNTTDPSADTEDTEDPEEDKEAPEDTGEAGGTEETGDTKDAEDETSKGPQWSFAPQQTGYGTTATIITARGDTTWMAIPAFRTTVTQTRSGCGRTRCRTRSTP